jgi:hypothetical protein
VPRAPRRVVALDLVDDRLGQIAAALGVQLGQALAVTGQRRVVRAGGLVEQRSGRLGDRLGRQRVEGLRPLAAVADEAGLAQPTEVGGHPRLGNAGDADQIRHAQLAGAQERAQPQAALVTEEGQRVDVARQYHPDIPIDG